MEERETSCERDFPIQDIIRNLVQTVVSSISPSKDLCLETHGLALNQTVKPVVPSTPFDFEEEEEQDTKLSTLVLRGKRKLLDVNNKEGKDTKTTSPVDVKKSKFETDIPSCSGPPPNVRKRSVGYVYSPNLISLTNSLPVVKGRAARVHSLIESFRLTSRIRVVESRPASEKDITTFHSQDYVEYVKELEKKSADDK